MATTTLETTDTTTTAAPIVVDLGKQGRKRVKRLREGRGPLMAEIAHCVSELQAAGTIPLSAQPVIIIVRRKARRRTPWPLG